MIRPNFYPLIMRQLCGDRGICVISYKNDKNYRFSWFCVGLARRLQCILRNFSIAAYCLINALKNGLDLDVALNQASSVYSAAGDLKFGFGSA